MATRRTGLEDGPEFDTSSFHVPEEALRDGPARKASTTKQRSGPGPWPYVVGGLIALGGAILVGMTYSGDDADVEVLPQPVQAATPTPAPPPVAEAPAAPAAEEKKEPVAAAEKKPEPKKIEPKKEAPKKEEPKAEAKEPAKTAKAPAKKKRKRSRRRPKPRSSALDKKLDQALENLPDLPAPEEE